jgi:hypothetical protein
MISGSDYIYSVNIILFNVDLKFPCQLGESDEFGIRHARKQPCPADRPIGQQKRQLMALSLLSLYSLDWTDQRFFSLDWTVFVAGRRAHAQLVVRQCAKLVT